MTPSPDRIPTEHFRSMDLLESTYWWHQNRLKLAVALLSKTDLIAPTILDLGCGTGNFVSSLGTRLKAKSVVGIDASPTAIEYSRMKDFSVINGDLETPQQIEGGHFDLVTAMDVIEHMKTESCILESAYINLRPNGYLLISAPAYQFLFSHWDFQLSHYRRYTRKTLRKTVDHRHFEIVRNTYAFSYALLPAIIRKFSLQKEAVDKCEFPAVPNWINTLLDACGSAEAQITKAINLPAGLSVFILLRKSK